MMQTGLVAWVVVVLGILPGCSDDAESQSWDAAKVIAFNELSATGAAEWLELVNMGSSSVDLAGFGLTDTSKSSGAPKLSGKMVFPAGSRLDPGQHLVVLTGRDDEAPGPYSGDECSISASCFFAGFSVSASTGETVYLLAPDDSVVSSTSYPKELSPKAGQTVCRLPDMTGAFALCTGTPGEPNEAIP